MSNSTSSYYSAGKRQIDRICFASFNTYFQKGDYIIVENSKIDSRQKFLKFIEYISEFCQIDHVIETEEEIRIFPKECKEIERSIICIIIRFAWDGRNGGNDCFYKIYDLFVNLVLLFPETDKLILLLFAQHLSLSNKTSYNSNHALTRGDYSGNIKYYPKLIDIKTYRERLDKYQYVSSYLDTSVFDCRLPPLTTKQSDISTKEEYEELLTEILEKQKNVD
jgi:hypothetical protein